MEKEKLSILNDEFDIGLAILIIRKNLFFIFLSLFVGFSVAYFINRYTTPQYSASSIVKISEKNDVNQMMNFENIYETNLVAELSRLKSKKMLSEAITGLSIDVDYFTKGKFLDTENYLSNPFLISYQVKNNKSISSPLIISFKNGIGLVSREDNDSATYLVPPNKWISIDGIELKIRISNRKLNELNKDELNDTYWEIETDNYLNGKQIKDLEQEKDQMIRKLDLKNNTKQDNEVYEVIISLCKKYEELCVKKYPEAPLPLEILKTFD